MTALEYTPAQQLEHDAFVYDSDEGYTAVLVPLVEAALRAGDGVVAVTPARNERLLRDALGPAAADVSWIAAEEWYRRPVRTIAAYDGALRQLDGRPAFVIGEVQFGDTDREWIEWTRYEAALNRALQRHAARVVCPYDERSLPAAVVADACRTHPHLLGAGERVRSADYVEPEELLPALAVAVEVPDRPADLALPAVATVRAGRGAFTEAARRSGFGEDRAHELVVGVSEVLTNAIVHGGGTASVRLWEGDPIVCVVEDAGNGVDDPLLGLRPPTDGAERGYGLWYTRQVFDRVELARSPLGGLLVHLEARPTGAA